MIIQGFLRMSSVQTKSVVARGRNKTIKSKHSRHSMRRGDIVAEVTVMPHTVCECGIILSLSSITEVVIWRALMNFD